MWIHRVRSNVSREFGKGRVNFSLCICDNFPTDSP